MTPDAVAEWIVAIAAAESVAAVSIDAPQGWRDPRRSADEGEGRACERSTRAPGKTLAQGLCKPPSSISWVELGIALFAELRARGAVVANDPDAATGGDPTLDRLLLVESFPTSTWRTSQLAPLPPARRKPDLDAYARDLCAAYVLPAAGLAGASHDDLQAIVCALPAVGLLGGPVRAVPRGVPGSYHDGVWVEGLIWDAEPTTRPRAPEPVEKHTADPRAVPTPSIPALVLVNGPPAAGKTTLARELARALGFPLLSKDDLKESLFDSLGTGDRAWSRRLGVATFHLLYVLVERQLEAGRSAVVEANFDAEYACPRIEKLRARHPFRVVEVYVTAPEPVLRARFAQRAASGERHRGHLDDVVARELDAGDHADRWAPLPCGDTLVRVDATAVGGAQTRRAVERVAQALGRDHSARSWPRATSTAAPTSAR